VELWLSEAARELQLQVELSLFALQMQAMQGAQDTSL